MRLLPAAFALLALAAATPARAERVVVRVVAGDDPVARAGVKVLKAKHGIVFDVAAWGPDALTDERGEAVVEIPKAGRILVYAPGFAVAVAAPDRIPVDVELRPERPFAGVVTDAGGAPVGGAIVRLETTFRRRARFLARTDGRGKFALFGLWFDNYDVVVAAAGFLESGLGGLADADSGRTFVVARPCVLAGVVRDAEKEPLAGVRLLVDSGEAATTDEKGRFRAADLAPGEHTLEVREPFALEPKRVVLEDGEVRANLDLVALRPATLKLRIVDEAGKPRAGVRGSGADGGLLIRVAPRRRLELALGGEGLVTTAVPVGPENPGATRDLGDVVVAAIPLVEVRVRRPDGKPAPKGSVGAVPLVEGKAEVAGLQAYTVAVPGFARIDIEATPPGPVEVSLPEPRWQRGIVLDPAGKPAPGATITSGPGLGATTDGEGRFRIGPFATDTAYLLARKGVLQRELPVTLGDAELEIQLQLSLSRFVRGRVERERRPVQRFSVDGRSFVDEEGRFETMVPGSSRWITVDVDGIRYPQPLPASGSLLVVTIPGGGLDATLEGAPPGREVIVSLAGGRRVAALVTGVDGMARFTGLRDGTYTVDADGFLPVEARVTDGDPPTVVLHRAPNATLRIRYPVEMTVLYAITEPRSPGLLVAQLEVGRYRHVFEVGGPHYGVTVTEVSVREEQETLVDLAPAAHGLVFGRAAAGANVWLERRSADARIRLAGRADASGGFRFPRMPAGTYAFGTGPHRRTIEVEAGMSVEVILEGGAHVVAGRVRYADSKPAAGVVVSVYRQGDERVAAEAYTDPRGAFRVAGLVAGEYECVAHAEGHAPGSATITVSEDGVETDGLPITLLRSAGVRLRIVGLLGERLAGLEVRLDGRWSRTDALGELEVHRLPAVVDLDLAGYGSVRDHVVRANSTLRLRRGARLVVMGDDPVVVRIGGDVWARLRPAGGPDVEEGGRLVFEDLPPGPVEVEVRREPAPDGEEREDPEDPDAEPPEPEIVRATLRSGAETVLHLRSG